MQKSFKSKLILTESGNHRSENQDSYMVSDNVIVVCDGMGGLELGKSVAEFVSSKAHKEFTEISNSENVSQEILEACIYDINNEVKSRFGNSGTTLSVVGIFGQKFFALNVGDSDIYLVRGDRIEELSTPQNMAQVTGIPHQSNILMNYIGKHTVNTPNLVQGPLMKGDIFICCSDGVSNSINIREVLTDAIVRSNLTEVLHEADPTDNYTVVVSEVVEIAH